MSIFSFARKAAERLYEGKCNIYELENTRDEDTKQTRQTESLVYEAEPCRISFEDAPKAEKYTDTVYEKKKVIKLFISPEIKIKPGSRIEVTQNGETESYKASGEPKIYASHREIELEIFERWA